MRWIHVRMYDKIKTHVRGLYCFSSFLVAFLIVVKGLWYTRRMGHRCLFDVLSFSSAT